jgi:hypothetical protein
MKPIEKYYSELELAREELLNGQREKLALKQK